MNPSDHEVWRRDRVVIMARGRSSRMGVPKGLLRLTESGPAFVRVIAQLYLSLGFAVEVVTRTRETDAYCAVLPVSKALRIVPAPAGGDTALTLLAAWRTGLAAGNRDTHFWAHPVDLPLVEPETIELLLGHSNRNPQRVIRPLWRGTPGHPVVLPGAALEDLDRRDEWHDKPLREFLSAAVLEKWLPDLHTVEVADQGVVRDFDRPVDFDVKRS